MKNIVHIVYRQNRRGPKHVRWLVRFLLSATLALGLFLVSPGIAGDSAGKYGSVQKNDATSKPQSKPAKPPQSAAAIKVKIPDSQRDFCNLVWRCGLVIPPESCPDTAALERTNLVYDHERCQEARLLNARGVKPDDPQVGFRLYRFLGFEYRVVYTVEDDIPISEARLNYLLGDLPLSAKLVSYFQQSPYTARYTDFERKSFSGTKGKHLRGDARLISGSAAEKRLFYFGTGVADVAWWTLRGPALLDFSFVPYPDGKALRYKMRILVFPGNGVINGIMNLGLFRKIVHGKIHDVLTDITETAHKLAAAGHSGFQNGKDWTPEDRKKIEAFLKLP